MAELDLGEAFNYPLRQWQRLLAVGLMIFPGVLLLYIPAIISEGYFILAAASLLAGGRDLPELKDFWLMFKKGLGSIFVTVVYCVLWFICISAVFFVAAIVFDLFISAAAALLGAEVVLISMIFGIGLAILLAILLILFFAVTPLFMSVHYAKVGSVRALVDFVKPIKVLRAAPASAAILLLISVILNVADYVSFFTIILIPVMGVTSAYVSLVVLHLGVQIYRNTENSQ
jgi:hypothetical protein